MLLFRLFRPTSQNVAKTWQEKAPAIHPKNPAVNGSPKFWELTPEQVWANAYLASVMPTNQEAHFYDSVLPHQLSVRSAPTPMSLPTVNDQFNELESIVQMFKKRLQENLGNNLPFSPHELSSLERAGRSGSSFYSAFKLFGPAPKFGHF